MFLHDCANAIWSLKGPEGLHLFVLVTFLCKKISITLQRMQMSSILSWDSHRLNYFLISTVSRHACHHQGQPIVGCQFLTWRNMANLLQAVGFGHGEILTSTLS
jgi:hypothetical protein